MSRHFHRHFESVEIQNTCHQIYQRGCREQQFICYLFLANILKCILRQKIQIQIIQLECRQGGSLTALEFQSHRRPTKMTCHTKSGEVKSLKPVSPPMKLVTCHSRRSRFNSPSRRHVISKFRKKKRHRFGCRSQIHCQVNLSAPAVVDVLKVVVRAFRRLGTTRRLRLLGLPILLLGSGRFGILESRSRWTWCIGDSRASLFGRLLTRRWSCAAATCSTVKTARSGSSIPSPTTSVATTRTGRSSGTIIFGARFGHRHPPATQFPAVHGADCFGCLIIGSHRDKAESTRLASVAILDERDVFYGADFRKGRGEILFGCAIGQVPHVEFICHGDERMNARDELLNDSQETESEVEIPVSNRKIGIEPTVRENQNENSLMGIRL